MVFENMHIVYCIWEKNSNEKAVREEEEDKIESFQCMLISSQAAIALFA